jgi:hypothetical protein
MARVEETIETAAVIVTDAKGNEVLLHAKTKPSLEYLMLECYRLPVKIHDVDYRGNTGIKSVADMTGLPTAVGPGAFIYIQDSVPDIRKAFEKSGFPMPKVTVPLYVQVIRAIRGAPESVPA